MDRNREQTADKEAEQRQKLVTEGIIFGNKVRILTRHKSNKSSNLIKNLKKYRIKKYKESLKGMKFNKNKVQ